MSSEAYHAMKEKGGGGPDINSQLALSVPSIHASLHRRLFPASHSASASGCVALTRSVRCAPLCVAVISVSDSPIVVVESRALVLFRTVLSGVGFLCDAYDLFIMNVVLVVLGCDAAAGRDGQHNDDNAQSVACFLSPQTKSLLATAVLVGSVSLTLQQCSARTARLCDTDPPPLHGRGCCVYVCGRLCVRAFSAQIVGQLMFGVLADYLGRRRSFIATLSLLVVGAALSSASRDVGALSAFAWLAVARFVLGVGVGGEYPLSATVSSEASVATEGRGRRVSLVFSMQGVGLVLAPAVILILLQALPEDSYALTWRLALALGGVPGVCMLYFRFRMKETAAFSAEAAHARDSREKWTELRANARNLAATCGSWLIFDVVFYANSLFSSEVVKHFITAPQEDADAAAVHSYLVDVALSTLFLSLCALPGYFAAMAVIDRWGRRRLQLFGFAGMSAAYIVCALTLPWLSDHEGLFYAVYGLSFFFSNMGPNTTTFVIPAELFPTTIRATAHGLSAASGKVGAAIGTALMPLVLSASSLAVVLYLSAAVSVLGLLWTWQLTVESMNFSVLLADSAQVIRVVEGDEDDGAPPINAHWTQGEDGEAG